MISIIEVDLELKIEWIINIMQNNFVLRSVRYMLDLSDAHVVEIMKLADYTVTKELVNSWLKKTMNLNLSSVTIMRWDIF